MLAVETALDPTIGWRAEDLARQVSELTPEDLSDPRVRAKLHQVRKTLDQLLDRAERHHHPGGQR